MEKAHVIFTLKDLNFPFQCSKDDKLGDICKKFAILVNKNLDSFIFLYEGNKVNLQLSFDEQATPFDRNNNEMKVLAYEIEYVNIICPECGEIIKLNKEMFDDIIFSNNEIKDTINRINLEIEKIIKSSSMISMKNELENINKMLYMINENINKNNKKIKSLINNIKTINDNIINSSNNNFHKTTKTDNESNKEKNIKGLIKSNIKEEKDKNLNNKMLFANIKSNKILKKVFSNLEEKIKLKAIKYNKYLQKKIDINLIHYKFLSGKYIIYEESRKGKEYIGCNDDLMYEGEFLYGERNGKGKEYDKYGRIEFEGEYLNGKRNGKGEEYEHGKIKFKGEYLNGIRHGQGKEYDLFGNINFDGVFLNGKKWRENKCSGFNCKVDKLDNGKLYIKKFNIRGILEFEAEFLYGEKNGKGKEYHFGSLIFEGEYLNGKKNGKGKKYIKDKISFEGEYLYNMKLKGKEYVNWKIRI